MERLSVSLKDGRVVLRMPEEMPVVRTMKLSPEDAFWLGKCFHDASVRAEAQSGLDLEISVNANSARFKILKAEKVVGVDWGRTLVIEQAFHWMDARAIGLALLKLSQHLIKLDRGLPPMSIKDVEHFEEGLSVCHPTIIQH